MRTPPLALFIAITVAIAAASLLAQPAGQRIAVAAGCVPAKPQAAGNVTESLVSSGQTREYIVHVPPSYNGSDPVPLVFSFHGLGSNAQAEELYSQLSTRANAPGGGFVVVYPQGLVSGSGDRYWNVIGDTDVVFTNDMLDALEGELCIDANRVFSSGMSNGAEMSVRLACSLSSRVAAIAPVAGAYYPPLLTAVPSETCPDTRAVPVIAFHGTADTTIPFDGGTGIGGADFRLALDNDTPDDDVMQSWAAHNGCASGRQESAISSEVRLIEYTSCVDGATAQLYAVDGGGHTWPGAVDVPPLGYTTHDISATDLMWAFFQAHPMPGTLPPADTDGDTVPDAEDADNDNDGCSDAQEAGPNAAFGGQRSHKNFWDYADMPDPNMVPMRDGRVRTADTLRVIDRYFTDDADATATINRNSDPLSVPPKSGYHPAYDRTMIGPDVWNLGPPNGEIRVDDILHVVKQFFHDCA